MVTTSYTYDILLDCPQGKINTTKLQYAIASSAITVAIDRIDTHGNDLIIYFKSALSGAEQNILDGGSGSPYNTHPAGGLISTADNSDIVSQPSLVSQVKPTNYNRRYGFSPNFSDQTTWWEQAIKVTNEQIGIGDGITTVFNLSHGNATNTGECILDLEHGKVTEEDFMKPDGGDIGDYCIKVYVNNELLVQREAFETSGGDFSVDYTQGVITFFIAPNNTAEIKSTYWYIPAGVGPTYTFKPSSGMQLIIDDVECSFSADIEQLDTMYSGVWLIDYGIWAPVEKNPTPYKTILDFFNYTYGAFPVVPAIGSNERGFSQNSITIRWDFKSYVVLNSNDTGSPAFKVSTKHNRKPFSGLGSTLTIYALEVPLSNKII